MSNFKPHPRGKPYMFQDVLYWCSVLTHIYKLVTNVTAACGSQCWLTGHKRKDRAKERATDRKETVDGMQGYLSV